MGVSKAIAKIVDGSYMDSLSERERVIFKMKYGDEQYPLTAKEEEILQRATVIHQLLMNWRHDRSAAIELIKEKYPELRDSRRSLYNAINDAEYLYGSLYTLNKDYMRAIQLDDIERGLKMAFDNKDGKTYALLLKERRELLRLDEIEEHQGNPFDQITIVLSFRPENYPWITQDSFDKALEYKRKAMIKVGLIKEDGTTEEVDATIS